MIRRLVRLWWRLWAATVGEELVRAAELPPGSVAAPVSAERLIAAARAAGAADARARMTDSWSYGGPGDEYSGAFEPPYVRSLRSQCQAALSGLRTRQRLTEGRLALLYRRSELARRRMQQAADRMSDLATREAAREAVQLAAADVGSVRPVVRAAVEPPTGPDPTLPEQALPETADVAEPEQVAADHARPGPAAEPEPYRVRWEGESMPLPAGWRVLILAGLMAAQFPMQLAVFEYLLGQSASAAPVVWAAVATALVLVLGPFLAGTALRTRAGTGADRRILYSVLVLVTVWLVSAVALALVRVHVLLSEAGGGARRPSSATAVVVFSALLLVVGVMAFILGQARRHPFQEAYVRQRRRRERLESLAQMTGLRLNPAYLPTEPGGPQAALEPVEQEIVAAYEAAIDAYFAALCLAKGDPAFTEAVQHRRVLTGAHRE